MFPGPPPETESPSSFVARFLSLESARKIYSAPLTGPCSVIASLMMRRFPFPAGSFVHPESDHQISVIADFLCAVLLGQSTPFLYDDLHLTMFHPCKQYFWGIPTCLFSVIFLNPNQYRGGGEHYSFSSVSLQRLELRPSNFQTFSFYLLVVRKI